MGEVIEGAKGNLLVINDDGSIKRQATSVVTVSTTNASTVSQVLKAANSDRKGLTIMNDDGTGVLYVAFAPTDTTLTHTVRIPAYGYYEMPLPIYVGAVAGTWSTTTGGGKAFVTEF